MTLPIEQMVNGLTIEHDHFFRSCPNNPEMRESTSLWLFEEHGAFGFPRLGIEAEASNWDNRRVQGNFAFADGRVLDGAGRGPAHASLDASGQPSVLGAGPLSFRCLEPFRTWQVEYSGDAADGTVSQQIRGNFAAKQRCPVSFTVTLEMVTPAWVQDNSPAKVAQMSAADATEAANMGIGWRFEHLFRGAGTLHVDGQPRSFNAVGLRVKRQSVRPLSGFRGHCWQSAVFPDGRAFGYIAYPPREDGQAYNQGYIFQNGRMYPARATKIPWLRRIVGADDDVSLELESSLGTTRIHALSALSTFRVGNPDIGGLNLHQGGACYRWDDQEAYGMIERSAHESLTTIGD